MPIDIASGNVHLEFQDQLLPGRINLVWDRRFSNSLLERSKGILGNGWISRYEASLSRIKGGYEFTGPAGNEEQIPDPEGNVALGLRARNLTVNLEVFKDLDRFIVQNWDFETCEVVRYVFVEDERSRALVLDGLEDLSGNAIKLRRNNQGQIDSIFQAVEGRELKLKYNQQGLVIAIDLSTTTGSQKAISQYEYDAQGYLVAAFDAANVADRYEYGNDGRLVRELRGDGGLFQYRYDEQGRCIFRSGLDGYDEKRLKYLDAARITEVTNSYGAKSYFKGQVDGKLTAEINPLGMKTETFYDAMGRIITRVEPTGAETSYEYDSNGNRRRTVNALGESIDLTFNDNHQPLTLRDQNGQLWKRSYDGAHRLIESQDPLSAKWQFFYDSQGNMTQIRSPIGTSRTFGYANNILSFGTDYSGEKTHLEHDEYGRLTQRIDSLGYAISYQYDAVGNVRAINLPDGGRIQLEYDQGRNLTKIIDAAGRVTVRRHGACQRLLETIDGNGNRIQYTWGTEPDRLEEAVNEAGESMRFEYDQAGQCVKETGFDGRVLQFTYDASGLCSRVVNGCDQAVTIERDLLGRIVSQKLSDGSLSEYAYDKLGSISVARTADCVVSFERDKIGRLVREIFDSRYGVQYVEHELNAIGSVTSMATDLGMSIDYELDVDGRWSSLTTSGGNKIEFRRDQRGMEVERRLPGSVRLTQQFDPVGRILKQNITGGPTHLAGLNTSNWQQSGNSFAREYIRDVSGLVVGIDGHPSGRVDYGYDPAERLTSIVQANQVSVDFEFDTRGNVVCRSEESTAGTIKQERLVGPGNRLLQVGLCHMEYDAQGRLIRKIEDIESDESKSWTYEWDALSQLRRVTNPNGESWDYEYDAFSRRIAKSFDGNATVFTWSGNSLVQEFSTETGKWRGYLFDQDSFIPLGIVDKYNFFSVVADHRGAPLQIRNQLGESVWTSSLDVFGNQPDHENSINCPFRLQGQYFDDESKLSYNRYRYYDSDTGVFISQDPIRLQGGINFYGYGKNQLNWTDPLGLSTEYPVLAQKQFVKNAGDEMVAMAKPSTKPSLLPTHEYVNPGHHDPSSGNYVATKSVLPANHVELFNSSVPRVDPKSGKVTYWAKEGSGKSAVYHRFQEHTDGQFHWNGSTNGLTKSGQDRSIAPNNVPNCVK